MKKNKLIRENPCLVIEKKTLQVSVHQFELKKYLL